VVIVGASVAGVAVARGLRAEGYEREIVVLGAEADWPYDKPPLSKQLLSGEWEAERTSLLIPAQAEELALDVRLGLAAEALDVAAQEVVLADGTRVAYGACVVATGSSARPSPWPERPGVHVLRTLQDALAIRERLRAGGSVAVVGGGFIGAEVASSAHTLGVAVTVIDPLELPMERAVGADAGRLFAELAARKGIELRLGHGVEAIEGTAGALALRLTDGSTVHADTAVVGIGALPNDGWLASSGLLVDNGLVCDEHCRAAGAENVFAAGDVARWQHPEEGRLVRVEHWTNAVDQAGCVAHNLAHPDDLRPYVAVPYVWTDQHGWKFQIAGHPESASRHEVVGDLAAEKPRAALLYADADGILTGAVTLNWPRALAQCRRSIGERVAAESAAGALSAPAAAA
jgi:3-phenylpropionate/trans-cinnamate dioxygenase ferredoxin reductase component